MIQRSSLEARWSCLGLLTLEEVKRSGRVPLCLTLRRNICSSQEVWGFCRRPGCSSRTKQHSGQIGPLINLAQITSACWTHGLACRGTIQEETHQEEWNLGAVLHKVFLWHTDLALLNHHLLHLRNTRRFPSQNSHTHTHGVNHQTVLLFPTVLNDVKTFVLGKIKSRDDR